MTIKQDVLSAHPVVIDRLIGFQQFRIRAVILGGKIRHHES
jgi:hypothetical protein